MFYTAHTHTFHEKNTDFQFFSIFFQKHTHTHKLNKVVRIEKKADPHTHRENERNYGSTTA